MTKNFGRDDLMAVAAFRYSLGRMTYIVSDCVELELLGLKEAA